MKTSLRVRLFMHVCIALLLISLTLVLMNTFFLDNYYLFQEKKMLKTQALRLNALQTNDYSEHLLELESIEKTYNVAIVIVDKKNHLVYCTDTNKENETLTVFDQLATLSGVINPNIISTEDDGPLARYEIQKDSRVNVEYISYRMITDKYDMLEVKVIKNAVHKSARVANQFTCMILLIAMGILLIWAYFFSKSFTKPIVQINRITNRMSNFDFSEQCKVQTKDEIGQLGESINIVSRNMELILNDLQIKNKRLEQDIERERGIDKLRKEFVSNVSHELKTPIAIIQGYAEGLRLNIAKDEERKALYCEIIEKEALKMDKLVKQLLELSQMESRQMLLNRTEFDLNELVRNIVFKFNQISSKTPILLTIDAPEQERLVFADELRIEQVMTNYINNAFSHVDEQNVLTVTVKNHDSMYRVEVYNSGRRIGENAIDKIWDSFYREDQARSRESGRNGLGLSIVRAIMQVSGGNCGVENQKDGVMFWFEISGLLLDGNEI